MRRLRILVEWSRGKFPVLMASAVVPVASCSGDDEHARSTSQAGRGGLASDAAADARGAGGSGGASGAFGFGGVGGAGGFVFDAAGGAAGTGIGRCSYTYTVDLPPVGIPASPGQICPISTEPVRSNRAARITLTKIGTDIGVVEGHVAIEPMLAGQVTGLPTLSVLETNYPVLASFQITEIAAEPGGFKFRGTWPAPLDVSTNGGAQMTLKVAFEIACDADAQDLKTVEALTAIHLCVDENELEWVSSGDDCTICRIIAEMAPSPIVPDKIPDGASDGAPWIEARRGRAQRLGGRCGVVTPSRTEYDAAMKCRIGPTLVVVTVGFLAACSGEEELHSGSPCLEGQHQECKEDEANIRCKCVDDADGAGTSDGGPPDADDTDAGGD